MMIANQNRAITMLRDSLRPAALIFSLIFVLWLHFFYLPYRHALTIAQQKHATNTVLIKGIHAIALNNKELKDKIATLHTDVSGYHDSEQQHRTQELLFTVLDTAIRNGLTVQKSEISYQSTSDDAQKNSIHYAMTGSLHQFVAFVTQMATMRTMACSFVQCTKQGDTHYSFGVDIPVECLKKTLQPRTS